MNRFRWLAAIWLVRTAINSAIIASVASAITIQTPRNLINVDVADGLIQADCVTDIRWCRVMVDAEVFHLAPTYASKTHFYRDVIEFRL